MCNYNLIKSSILSVGKCVFSETSKADALTVLTAAEPPKKKKRIH